MAKAPVPGRVKTRLIPTLGAEGAARLHAHLLRSTVTKMLAAELCPVQLWCAPDTEHPDFAALEKAGARLECQCDGNLGARMAHIARTVLAAARQVVIVGTDIPDLDAPQVEAALTALAAGHDAVLGPTEDGGYCLLGLARTDDELFRGMPWSTARVADVTRRRLVTLGWTWSELPELWDLDRPEDWKRLATSGRYGVARDGDAE